MRDTLLKLCTTSSQNPQTMLSGKDKERCVLKKQWCSSKFTIVKVQLNRLLDREKTIQCEVWTTKDTLDVRGKKRINFTKISVIEWFERSWRVFDFPRIPNFCLFFLFFWRRCTCIGELASSPGRTWEVLGASGIWPSAEVKVVIPSTLASNSNLK